MKGLKFVDSEQLVLQCVQKMKAENLTNREVAQLANISEATVSRLIRSGGANATAASLLAVCNALGVGVQEPETPAAVQQMQAEAVYAARVADLKETILVKDRWIRALFITCLTLLLALLFLLFYDALRPGVGWLRR